jgi:hypothetical protein
MFVNFNDLQVGEWFMCDDGDIGQKITVEHDNYALFFGGRPYDCIPQDVSYNPKVKRLQNVRLVFDEPVWIQNQRDAIEVSHREIVV